MRQGGTSVLTDLLPGRWNPVIISALKRFVGYWEIRLVQLESFWMVPKSSYTSPPYFLDGFTRGLFLSRVG